MTKAKPKPTPGRPKDEAASTALKKVALEQVRQRGYANVSIASIITAAGVSRQTLYNRWATKAELVLDAMLDRAGLQVTSPDLSCETPRQQLLSEFLAGIFFHLRRDGETLSNLIAAAQDDPGFRDLFWKRFVQPRQDIVTTLLTNAQARGELSPKRDVTILSTFVHGYFWYRLLNGHQPEDHEAERISKEIFCS